MKNGVKLVLDDLFTRFGRQAIRHNMNTRSFWSGSKSAISWSPSEIRLVCEYIERPENDVDTTRRFVISFMTRFATTRKNKEVIEDNLTNCMVFNSVRDRNTKEFLEEMESKLIRGAANLLYVRYTQAKGLVDSYDVFIDRLKDKIVERLDGYMKTISIEDSKKVILEVIKAKYDGEYLRFMMIEVAHLSGFKGLPFVNLAQNLLNDTDEAVDSICEAEDPFELLWEWLGAVPDYNHVQIMRHLFDVFALINFTQTRDFQDSKTPIDKKLVRFEGIEVI